MLWSSVSAAPSAISSCRVGGSPRPRFPPPSAAATDVGWVRPLLPRRERRAFILLHTGLKCSQVRRGCHDQPRAALTGGAKAAPRHDREIWILLLISTTRWWNEWNWWCDLRKDRLHYDQRVGSLTEVMLAPRRWAVYTVFVIACVAKFSPRCLICIWHEWWCWL